MLRLFLVLSTRYLYVLMLHMFDLDCLQNGEEAGLTQHTPTGVSPIMLAALLGSTDCLKLLLRHIQSNILTHHVDAQGLSVLHYSTWGKVTHKS